MVGVGVFFDNQTQKQATSAAKKTLVDFPSLHVPPMRKQQSGGLVARTALVHRRRAFRAGVLHRGEIDGLRVAHQVM
jgi:hypothetical protein